MEHTQPASNPFALMMDPSSVFQAIERSERLACLKSRICRPLDKPLIPVVGAADAGVDAEDEAHDDPDASDDEHPSA